MKHLINICLITDDNYAPYVGVTLYSILKNACIDDNFNFHIFDNGISETNKDKLKLIETTNCKINFIDLSEWVQKINNLQQTIPHISKTSYLKFFIADILKDFEKIIYLDCDLVVETSLNDLYNINTDDYLLAAVEDVGYTYWSKHNEDLKLKFKCINSGVMLINCKKWRETNLSQYLLDCAANHDKVGFGQDQPVFNYVCKDKVLFLDHFWNVQDTYFRDEIEINSRNDIENCHYAKNNPKIIHYTYIRKPWNYPFMNQAGKFWDYYLQLDFINENNKKTYENLKILYDKNFLINSKDININEYTKLTQMQALLLILNRTENFSYKLENIDSYINRNDKNIIELCNRNNECNKNIDDYVKQNDKNIIELYNRSDEILEIQKENEQLLIELKNQIHKPTFIQQIFSVKNENKHKVVRFFGIKIELKGSNLC